MKVYAFILGILLSVGQAFAVEKWTDEAVQPGQDGGYYIINNEKELAWIALNTMNKESTYKIKLNADLDLKGKLWLPIGAGHGGNGFKGEFIGQGHSIKNLYIKSDELLSAYNDNCLAQNLGFFGINGGGTIKDFYLENVDIYATNSHINGCGNEISVGGLVGWKTASASTIENVVVSGKIYTSGKGQGVGGLIGNAHSSRISNSVSMVNITADGDSAFVGGIVGLVKNNEVKIDSCVYAGESLESNGNGGKIGAVAGRVYQNSANANMKDVYYDSDVFGDTAVGVVGPKGGKVTGEPSAVSNLNNEEVVCMLNKGTLDENGECDTQSPWSVGGQNISWNGSDGFKVTFDADGGTFPENSKTYKMLSNGNAITADEIALPTKDGAAFAGWSLTKGASEPALNLGVVTKPTRVYAVWKPVFTITFDANGGSFPDDGSLKKEKKVAKGDVITVEGIGNLPESYCKVSSTFGCDVTMFFTGWSFKSNPSTESEIVDLNNLDVFASKDTTLYAVWTSVETYTVTFNAGGHGKTKVNFVRVGAGETITKTVDPSADIGYQFGGWFTEDSILFEFETTPITKSIILYAHWTPVDYTITYMLEDGTNDSENPETYNIETPTFGFKAPSREGYTFEKWYYDAAFSEPATQITQGTTTGAKTLYAKWIPNVYTITYRAGSVGQGTVLPSKKEHGEAIDLKLINAGFSRNGYTQTGWTTTDGGEKVYESGESYTENHDLELFPTWSDPIVYTINYVCDGCTNDPSNRDNYTVETSTFSVKFKDLTPPDGYKMVGWYSATDYKNKVEQIKKGSFGDTTLYAKLNKIYKITYVGTDKPRCDTLYTVDDAITLRNPADSAGYTFGGWFTNANFEGDAATGIAKGSTGDTTFYAKWVPVPYTITYNIDGEPAELTPNTYTAASATELATPTRNGYEFDGWYSNDEYTGDKVTSIAAGSIGDTAFFAKWTPVEYSITYVLEEGEFNDNDNPASYTVETDAFTLKDAVKNGYTFEGWFNGECEKVTTVAGGATGNLELTAQFTIETYTITYHNVEGATFEKPNPETYTVETLPITLNNPTKDGYTFEGWFTDESFTGNPITGIETRLSNGNGDLYAKWSDPIEYAITYVGADDLENLNPTSYTVLENDLELQPVSKSGFKFLGWFNENDELVESISAGSTGDITLTAKWAVFPIVTQYGGVTITEYEDRTKLAEIDENNFDSPIEITENISVNTVVFNRVFKENTPSTIMLPFSIPMSEVEGGLFYGVTLNFSDGLWSAKAEPELSGVVQANTPYLYKPMATTITFNNTDPVVFNTNGSRVSYPHAEWTFKGVYSYKKFEAEDPELGRAYGFAGKTVNGYAAGEFVMVGAGAWLNPMRCYLVHNAPTTAKSSKDSWNNASLPEIIKIEFYDENAKLIDVGTWDLKSGNISMDRWYDLHGRLLNGKPTVQGTYYHNGKRVIVK